MGFLTDVFALAPLFIRSDKVRAERIYDLLATNNHLGQNSLYLNLGYWDGTDVDDYDAACNRMAHELALAVGMKPGHTVLDCGFGFADQDIYWATAFRPACIVGLNVTALQVEKARQRVSELGLDAIIDLRLGSATSMPLGDETVDCVTALESAFHFPTREQFLREAFRVLRPGGRVAAADMLPLEGAGNSFKEKLNTYVGRSFWQIPDENHYPASAYRERLEAIGFRNVEVRSIRDRVYTPYVRFLKKRLWEPELVARWDSLMLAAYRAAATDEHNFDHYDYVIAVGERP
jgi:ubiquinone/menaquinone biosynthesis C-methylase UbiE